MATTLPVLLPGKAIPRSPATPHLEWTPKKYLTEPQPPPQDEGKILEAEMANARQMVDGKLIKKTRPRRTVDYNGGLGRWALLRKLRPSPSFVPYLRPSPPFIIDLLPPKAYPDNASTSLCTKFVHTSTNKIRCPVNVVTWTPEGRRVLTGSTSGEFTLWNGLTFNFETILQAHDTAICTMEFTHSGAYLASADKSGIIKYFEPNMNNLTAWQGSTSREAIRGISFSPDDRRFATASDDSSVRIWSFAESRVESVLTGHGWDVKCVQWHPTKGLLVSGSKDNQIKFWDPRTGTVLSTLHQHKNTIQALAWSPNGNLVASASRDQTVRVFDIRAMKEFRILKGHKKEVCSVAWHPVHPILTSGGSEGAILHWDLSTPDPAFGEQPISPPRATLSQAHDSNVWSLAFHPLGHLLVSASNDHTTRFWSRERPGDTSSVFSGGGEKPPEIMDTSGQDEEDESMVPGFSYGGGGGGNWWGKEEDAAGGNGAGPSGVDQYGRSRGGEYENGMGDDFIPGFGASESSNTGRQAGPLPSQQDLYPVPEEWNGVGRGGGGGGGGGGGDWGRGGGRMSDGVTSEERKDM
ncbi:WD40-repeat-containing domain protein [Crucibulum laeve]|uniref:Polyadenylation factor subunit 2 n=1 Tax=Crucibulum laeve TaxID=68775 RepID=A0A5C3M1L7_9AGAR|nr:WD40-repeat-containing domain protein [Crucibulum laeve]